MQQNAHFEVLSNATDALIEDDTNLLSCFDFFDQVDRQLSAAPHCDLQAVGSLLEMIVAD